jgi:hypothetical protein
MANHARKNLSPPALQREQLPHAQQAIITLKFPGVTGPRSSIIALLRDGRLTSAAKRA